VEICDETPSLSDAEIENKHEEYINKGGIPEVSFNKNI